MLRGDLSCPPTIPFPLSYLNLSARRVSSWFPTTVHQHQHQHQNAKLTPSVITISSPPPNPKGRRATRCFASGESPYQVLGVPPSASVAEIKRAYRKLALKFHPDVNKQPNAQAHFLRIKHAYNTLLLARTSASASEPATKVEQDQEFYGLEDLFRDLQQEWEASASKGNPKSLWQELADIGEEFVEFLEKELNISSDSSGDNDGTDTNRNTPPQPNTIRDDIDDIEASLARLKKELGL